ncbi:MAG: hypothetical protein VXZ35_11730 [Pseudomonadota bacterium]|nr:hypothetical protein [Pseudomonadota bacterium]
MAALLEELLLALSSEKSISGSVSLLACSEGIGLSCVLSVSELDSEPS